jgi:hypothetical protein
MGYHFVTTSSNRYVPFQAISTETVAVRSLLESDQYDGDAVQEYRQIFGQVHTSPPFLHDNTVATDLRTTLGIIVWHIGAGAPKTEAQLLSVPPNDIGTDCIYERPVASVALRGAGRTNNRVQGKTLWTGGQHTGGNLAFVETETYISDNELIETTTKVSS